MKNLTAIPLIAIPLLTLAGCLYHVAFWSKFNINGLAYIDVSNIITSSVYPILSFGGFYFILDVFFSPKYEMKDESFRTDTFTYLLSVLSIVGIVYFYDKCKLFDWFFWALFLGAFSALMLYGEGLLKDQIRDSKQRMKILQAVCLGLSFSFATGKLESDKIFFNDEYYYTIITNNSGTINSENGLKIKYLGILGETYFFTDYYNSRMFIYNNLDALELHYYKKGKNKKK